MPRPYPDDSNNQELADMRVAANRLETLLGLFSFDVTNINLLTWQIIKERYPRTGMSKPAQKDIKQAQRIIHASRNHKHIGIWEYHIGLICLHWGEPHSALQYFSAAQRYWTLVNHTAAACLAIFAQGYMQHFCYQFEAAMVHYLRTQHQLNRLKKAFIQQDLTEFRTQLDSELTKAISELRKSPRHKPGTGPGGGAIEEVFTPSVLPPHTSSAANQFRDGSGPIPGHQKVDDNYFWYKIERKYQDDFLPDVGRNDWVLVKKSVANESIIPNDIVVVDLVPTDDVTKQSSIWLTNPESGKSTARPKIFLGRMRESSKTFFKDSSGKFQISNIQISEQHQAPIDIEKIIGIVIGFWTEKVNS